MLEQTAYRIICGAPFVLFVPTASVAAKQHNSTESVAV